MEGSKGLNRLRNVAFDCDEKQDVSIVKCHHEVL